MFVRIMRKMALENVTLTVDTNVKWDRGEMYVI